MGSRSLNTNTQTRVTKPPRCSVCRKEYTPACDFMQGRCPHHPAMLDMSLSKTRFQNIIKFFKGNKK
jgi:hypothetical protein